MRWDLKWLAWEVCARCNLRCVHCRCNAEMGGGEGIFTLPRAKALLDDIARFASPVIVLTGGEPLLRQDLPEILAYGTAKGFRMCMATNGTLLGDAWCDTLAAGGIKIVSLSLDGATARTHDDFRKQEGAFEGTLRGIECLKRRGIPFLINSSFTQRNVAEAPAAYALAKSLGARAWYMFCVVPVGRGEDLAAELLTPEQYRELLAWHLSMEKDEHEMLVRPTCMPQYYRLLGEAEKRGEGLERRSLSFSTGGAKGCVAGQSIALVTAWGDVKPCSYFPEAAGNLATQTLEEIWTNAPLFAQLRDFASYKGMCGHCAYLHACGGCRVRAIYARGDALGQDPICLPAFGPPERACGRAPEEGFQCPGRK